MEEAARSSWKRFVMWCMLYIRPYFNHVQSNPLNGSPDNRSIRLVQILAYLVNNHLLIVTPLIGSIFAGMDCTTAFTTKIL